LEILKYLITKEGKANVEVKDNYGENALMYACFKNRLEIVLYLIEVGNANVEAKTNDGWTALMIAAILILYNI
jgi:ankyrin repeat protein